MEVDGGRRKHFDTDDQGSRHGWLVAYSYQSTEFIVTISVKVEIILYP